MSTSVSLALGLCLCVPILALMALSLYHPSMAVGLVERFLDALRRYW